MAQHVWMRWELKLGSDRQTAGQLQRVAPRSWGVSSMMLTTKQRKKDQG